MSGAPSWFELGVGDIAEARKFYGDLLGWEFEPGTADDETGVIIRTPGLDGGIHDGDWGASPYLFFAVDDIDAALARVVELGGTILDSPGADPSQESEHGRFALCTDDQGSSFGLRQTPSDT